MHLMLIFPCWNEKLTVGTANAKPAFVPLHSLENPSCSNPPIRTLKIPLVYKQSKMSIYATDIEYVPNPTNLPYDFVKDIKCSSVLKTIRRTH